MAAVAASRVRTLIQPTAKLSWIKGADIVRPAGSCFQASGAPCLSQPTGLGQKVDPLHEHRSHFLWLSAGVGAGVVGSSVWGRSKGVYGGVVHCEANATSGSEASGGASSPAPDQTESLAAEFNGFAELNDDQSLQVFSGTSNPELARSICARLGIPLGRLKIGRFADGEVTLEILDEVRGKDVFVVQSAPSASLNSSPHSTILELCLLISALKRSSAKRVTAVLPYMSYFRQTTETELSRPLGGSDMGKILATTGVDRVIFVDVHSKRVEGFFPSTIPVTNLLPQSLAIEFFKRKKELDKSVVIVSTDNTGTEKAQAFMSRMQQAGFDACMATLVSNRPEREQKEAGVLPDFSPNRPVGFVSSAKRSGRESGKKLQEWLVGDVDGKDCVIVDDIIDTGERAVNTAYALKAAGARRVYMFATHGLFSRGAIDRIAKSPIKEVVVTDTIRIPENLYCEKLHVISVSRLLAEAVRRVHWKLPLSKLHRDALFDSKIAQDAYQQ